MDDDASPQRSDAPPPPLDRERLDPLLDAAGPSGFEERPAALWAERAEALGAALERSVHGAVAARFNAGGAPRLLLAAHLDEIGLAVTHIDDDGFLWCRPIGGWDPLQAIGQVVRIVSETAEGEVRTLPGVVGRKAPHLSEDDEAKRLPRWRDVWIDIGAKDGDEARRHVAPGAFAVIERAPVALLGGRLASRALDDRIGAHAVLEAAARAAAAGLEAEVIAVATTHEEIGGPGAGTVAYGLEPDLAVAVDVTHATDTPGMDPKREGASPLGSGAELAVGSYLHRPLLRRLRRLAAERGIPVTVAAQGARTATDADAIAAIGRGVPTALVSVPLRYMHSAVEIVDPRDVEHVVTLLAALATSLRADDDLG